VYYDGFVGSVAARERQHTRRKNQRSIRLSGSQNNIGSEEKRIALSSEKMS
jgi:hypothetical protein